MPGAPAWMVTYGDLMSLMLAFFILLVSFSEVRREKLEQALESFQAAVGSVPRPAPIPTREDAGPAPPPTMLVERAARDLQERLQIAGRDRDVRLEFDGEGGLRIVLPERILFEEGSARLRADAATGRVLTEVAKALTSLPGAMFAVRGHSSEAEGTEPDAFALSFNRALAVAERLSEVGPVSMKRCEVVACGPNEPAATNNTPAGQAANRRVEIHVKGDPALQDRERLALQSRDGRLQNER